jgi:hypothetical protein
MTSLYGQRTLTGKIIGAESTVARGNEELFFKAVNASIISTDSVVLGSVDEDGLFEIRNRLVNPIYQ